MAILKCKMCGGDIELSADKTFGTCESCGSTMTFPKVDDEQRANMFNRGNHFRRMGEFDKALAVYERIVQEDENDAEAHWCCALCRFGIEYVEDPNTFEYLPTCHRASFDSFLEDVDYLAALEHSDGITKRQYQKDAQKIAEVQRGILATSQNEEPFDVFICYKESENDGTRTRDSIMAQEIYYQLTEQGRRVFFSRITLEDKAGTEYEPYIFAALNSAKVMIVVTTSAEHVNAVWVKNEWSRFLSLMRKDRSKLLLPCYRDMDPYDLPEALSVLQSYDMGKIGFIQDLIRGVNKVLDASKPKTKETVKETVVVQQGNSNAAPLLKRAFMFLEDGDFTRADEFCEQVLNLDPENAEAYLGKLMAELHVKTRDTLKDQPEPFDNRNNYQKVMRFGDEKLKQNLTADNAFIRERNEIARKESIYQRAFSAMQQKTEAGYRNAAELFASISDFKDAGMLFPECAENAETVRKEGIYQNALSVAQAQTEGAYRKAEELFASISDYRDAAEKVAECQTKAEEAHKEELYQTCSKIFLSDGGVANTITNWQAAIKGYAYLKDYKDSEQLLMTCRNRLSALESAEKQKLIEEESIRKNYIYNLASQVASLNTVENLQKALDEWRKIPGWKDVDERIVETQYKIETINNNKVFLQREIASLEQRKETLNRELATARGLFNSKKRKDIMAQLDDCQTVLLEKKYLYAMALFKDAQYEKSLPLFCSIKGFKDSEQLYEKNFTILYGREKYQQLQKMKNLKVGDIFSFGVYSQKMNARNSKEAIQWLVLSKRGNRVLVTSKYALDAKPFHGTNDGGRTWEKCTLRIWLNNDFFNEAFTEQEKAMVPIVELKTEPPAKNTEDRVFLLSIQEVTKLFGTDNSRKCVASGYAIAHGASTGGFCWWWLRSPGLSQDETRCVYAQGSVTTGYGNKSLMTGAVRPAMWIDLSAIN